MKNFKTIDPQDLTTREVHKILLNAVTPRPIALASTIDEKNIPNLSPFSFFNVFSGNPPVLIFSPARRIRNNTEKDTLRNLKEIKEVVINVVNEDIAEKPVPLPPPEGKANVPASFKGIVENLYTI